MDVNSQKIKIVQWVLGLRDAQMNALLEDMATPESEIWDQMSATESATLKPRLGQADAGDLISHAEAMKKLRKWR